MKFRFLSAFLVLALAFGALVAVPLPKAEAASDAAGTIIPPAVDCAPYTPPADATTYSFTLNGTVTNGTTSMRAYLFAATYVDVTNTNQVSTNEYGTYFGMNSTYIPTGFACVGQAEVTNNKFSFQNMQVKYKPAVADFDIKGESLVGDDQVRFLVMVHDETGKKMDSWGQTVQCSQSSGSTGACRSSGSTSGNTGYLGVRDTTLTMTGSPSEVFATSYLSFLMRHTMYNPYISEITDCFPNTPGGGNCYNIDVEENPEAFKLSNFRQCILVADMNGTCTGSLGMYMSSFMYDVNGASNNGATHKTGTFPYSYSANGAYSVTIDMNIASGAPDAKDVNIPTNPQVGNTFTVSDSALTCYNSKGNALQKSGNTYTLTVNDYGTQIYCSKNSTIDTSQTNGTIWNYVTKANNATLNRSASLEYCPYDYRVNNTDVDYYVFYSCKLNYGNDYQKIASHSTFTGALYDSTKYTYESQTPRSNAVSAAPVNISGITFDEPPMTDRTSIASTACTFNGNTPCSSDSNFQYAYQWQRWNGTAWQTVGTSASYTPIQADWGDSNDSQHFGKMQVVTNVTYTGANAGAYAPTSYTEEINLTLNPNAPSIPIGIKCVQTADNQAFYSDITAYQCAFGDSLVVYPINALPAGWILDSVEWNMQHDCAFMTMSDDPDSPVESLGCDGNLYIIQHTTSDTLQLNEDEDWSTNPNAGFWGDSDCTLAIGVLEEFVPQLIDYGGCIFIPSVTFSKKGYADAESSNAMFGSIATYYEDIGEIDIVNQIYPSAPPVDWTPAFDYGDGQDHPMIGVPVNLTGLLDGDISETKQLATLCTVTYIPASGSSEVLVDKQDCSPNNGNLNYTPLAIHEGGRLQVDAYVIDELNCGTLVTCEGYSDRMSNYDALMAKVTKSITSTPIAKGDPLPANTLQFEPTRNTAKVGYELEVVTPPENWEMDTSTCLITLSDGTDVTSSGNCTDDNFSYTPVGADYNKSVTFSATYKRDGYYDSPLTITSKTPIQKGDSVTVPVLITGLLQTGTYATLSGVDNSSDWNLANCGLYRIKQGVADEKVKDCMTDRQYLITPSDVNATLQLRTTYTKYGYNDSTGLFTTPEIALGDYPYPTSLEILSDIDTLDYSTIVRVGKEATVYGLPDEAETGWSSNLNWQVCETTCDDENAVWQNITGETAEIFIPNATYLSKYIRAYATAEKAGYNTSTLWSIPFEVQNATTYDTDFQPAISGTLNVGRIVTVTNIPYSGDSAWSDFNYVWSYKDLGAADSTAVTLTNENGRQLTVESDIFQELLRACVTAMNVASSTTITRCSNWTSQIGEGLPIIFTPIIIGDVKVGETLYASGIPAQETGWNIVTYQWYTKDGATESAITDETDYVYTIRPSDKDKKIMVKIQATNGLENYQPSDAVAYAGANDINPDGVYVAKGDVPEFNAKITGQAYMGSVLSLMGILDSTVYTTLYVWERCISGADCTIDANWDNISSGTENKYVTVNEDVGNNVRAKVIASNTEYHSAYEDRTEIATPVITVQKAKAISYKPILSSNFTTGSFVVASGFPSQNSGWQITECTWRLYTSAGLDSTISGTPDSIGTGCEPYLIAATDVGKKLELTSVAQMTDLTDYYQSSTQSSAISQPIAAANFPPFTPIFIGTEKVGTELRVLGLPLSNQDATFTYTWQSLATKTSNPVPIQQEATKSLQLTADLINHYIKLSIKVQSPGYNDYTVSIMTDSPVQIGDQIEFTPRIIGIAKVGERLIVGDLPDSQLGWALTYEFKDQDQNLLATSKTYTPLPADISKTITVTINATKDGYADSINTSDSTDAVLFADAVMFEPRIAGADENNEVRVGGVLSASGLPAEQSGWNVTYAWYTYSGTYEKITDSDDADFVPIASDVGNAIYLGATATRDGYTTSSYYSQSYVTVINADFAGYDFNIAYDKVIIAPGEPGCAIEMQQNCTTTDGKHLSAAFTPNLPTLNQPTVAYEWFIADDATSAGVKIQGQEASTYAASSADEAHYIYASSSLTQAGYNSESYESEHLYISKIDPLPTFTPQFTNASGTKLDETLTVDEETLESYSNDEYTFSHVTWYYQTGATQDEMSDQYITSTTGRTLLLDNPDYVGKKIYAIVTETDPGVRIISGITESTVHIQKGDIEDFTPEISNTAPKVDDVLTVSGLPERPDNANTYVPDYDFTYSWKSGIAEVGTTSEYKVQGTDVDNLITVTVTASRGEGYNEKTQTSVATSAVSKGNAIEFTPTLTGNFMVNGTLTIEGLLDGYDAAHVIQTCTDQTSSNCTDYPEQPQFADASFEIPVGLADQYIRAKVTLSKQYYVDSVAYTDVSAKINASNAFDDYIPVILGNADLEVRVGSEVESEIGVDNPTASVEYQWQIADDDSLFSDIFGATDITYTPLVKDYQKYLRLQIKITADGYESVTKQSSLEQVQLGKVLDDEELLYCVNNSSAGDADNVVYKVGVALDICGLPSNFADSVFNFAYNWHYRDLANTLPDSENALRIPTPDDLGKLIDADVTINAEGYEAKTLTATAEEEISLGDAISLDNVQLSDHAPKVAETVRIEGLPDQATTGWISTYQFGTCKAGTGAESGYPCDFVPSGITDLQEVEYSFLIPPEMYGKELAVQVAISKNGYKSASVVRESGLIELGDPIDFTPSIYTVGGNVLVNSLPKVGDVLEIHGVPKTGDASLPFKTFTVAYEWRLADNTSLGTESTLTLTPHLLGKQIKCSVKITATGFTDSAADCENLNPVTVIDGSKIPFAPVITGVLEAQQYAILKGLPDETEGWSLTNVTWYACQDANDDVSECLTLSNEVNLDDYSTNPPRQKLSNAEAKKYIKAYVNFSKVGYADSSATATSSQVALAPVPVFNPQIVGGNRVGDQLRVTGAPAAQYGWLSTYQWLENGKPIISKTSKDFVITASQVGKNVSVKVTVSNSAPEYAGVSSVMTSSAVNILLGNALNASSANNFTPFIVSEKTAKGLKYYSIYGTVASSIGWSQQIAWQESGKTVKGATSSYLVSNAARKNVSAIIKLQRPGYASSTVTVR
jgi:hypothetical protein